MNLIESKVIAMIALGLGSFSMGLLPILLTRYSRNKYPLFLSALLCFGAGVLLSTSMVHMLPEIRESLDEYAKFTELLFCVGFFLLYCIDEIVHLCKSNLTMNIHSQEENNALLHNASQHLFDNHQNYGTVATTAEVQRQPSYNPNYHRSNSPTLQPSTLNCCNHSHDTEVQYKPSQLCHIGHQEPCQRTNTSSLSLIIALTVHAILEGLAVGLEDSTSQVLLMLGAIASHKLVVGFCLGAELSSLRHTTPCQYFGSIIMFSFGSVLGIGLGLSITDLIRKLPSLVIPILQALAGGTLLYVTVSEVLPRERAQWHQEHNRKEAGIIQFMSVTVGFVLMSLLIIFLHD